MYLQLFVNIFDMHIHRINADGALEFTCKNR